MRRTVLSRIAVGVATLTAMTLSPLVSEPHAGAAQSFVAPFHTSGNRILDSNNAPVIFKGVNDNEGDVNLSYITTLYTQSQTNPIKDLWKANMVR
jgi:hypothetical protein